MAARRPPSAGGLAVPGGAGQMHVTGPEFVRHWERTWRRAQQATLQGWGWIPTDELCQPNSQYRGTKHGRFPQYCPVGESAIKVAKTLLQEERNIESEIAVRLEDRAEKQKRGPGRPRGGGAPPTPSAAPKPASLPAQPAAPEVDTPRAQAAPDTPAETPRSPQATDDAKPLEKPAEAPAPEQAEHPKRQKVEDAMDVDAEKG